MHFQQSIVKTHEFNINKCCKVWILFNFTKMYTKSKVFIMAEFSYFLYNRLYYCLKENDFVYNLCTVYSPKYIVVSMLKKSKKWIANSTKNNKIKLLPKPRLRFMQCSVDLFCEILYILFYVSQHNILFFLYWVLIKVVKDPICKSNLLSFLICAGLCLCNLANMILRVKGHLQQPSY